MRFLVDQKNSVNTDTTDLKIKNFRNLGKYLKLFKKLRILNSLKMKISS
jgi:hypothetical protein